MSDDIDHMADRNILYDAAQVQAIRDKAVLATGKPGDCDFCGDWSGRLIEGVCAPCRDKRGLP